MRAIEILEDEHRQIERVLRVLVQASASSAEELLVGDAQLFLTAADFIRDYADRSHHAKEELGLFHALSLSGMQLDRGPLHCMLSDHTEALGHAKAMRESALSWTAGHRAAAAQVAHSARAYAGLLTMHIRKEDGFLFKMARRIIANRDAAVLRVYAEVDWAVPGGMAEMAAGLEQRLAERCSGLAPKAPVKAG